MIPLDPARLAATDPDTDPLLTVAEAARELGVHPDTVRWWIHDDRLPATRLRGRWHVLLSDASEAEHAARASGKGRPRRRVVAE